MIILNNKQLEVAKNNMIVWLEHPQELGKKPAKIEFVDTFILDDLVYYIFKFKKFLITSPWLIGVSGGYEQDSLENCGHTFSEFEPFKEETALSDAEALVKIVKDYWMAEAKKVEERKENYGSFIGFILLKDFNFDVEKLIATLRTNYNVKIDLEDAEIRDDAIITSSGDSILSISLMKGKIPEEEIYEAARKNYMCDIVDDALAHKAHILVTVLGSNDNILKKSRLFVKTMACCASLDNVIGLYTSGVVFEKNTYCELAKIMNEDEEILPIYNLVWFGLAQSENGISAYTDGLLQFGFDEIEVLNADTTPQELRDFICDLASYVLNYNVTLKDGETIGFSKDDIHKISYSEGVYLEGNTLKISFEAEDEI